MKQTTGNESIDDRFEKGIALRKAGKLREAAGVWLALLSDVEPSKSATIYFVLGGVYSELRDFNRSLDYFGKAAALKPHYEPASLGLYLSYVELEKYNEAIEELERFLIAYPADLYKTTLMELLDDLENGYAYDFRTVIVELARKHGVVR